MESSDDLNWTNPASNVEEFAHVCEGLVRARLGLDYGLASSFGSSGATLPIFVDRWRHQLSGDARMHYSGLGFPDPVASFIFSHIL